MISRHDGSQEQNGAHYSMALLGATQNMSGRLPWAFCLKLLVLTAFVFQQHRHGMEGESICAAAAAAAGSLSRTLISSQWLAELVRLGR